MELRVEESCSDSSEELEVVRFKIVNVDVT